MSKIFFIFEIIFYKILVEFLELLLIFLVNVQAKAYLSFFIIKSNKYVLIDFIKRN